MSTLASSLSNRVRWIALIVIAALALGGSAVYALHAYQRYQDRSTGVSAASVTDELPQGHRIVFRNTAAGEGYGMIAAVPLANPGGPRGLGTVACDRVDAADGYISCLRTIRGIPTSFETELLDTSGNAVKTWPLPGVPSRTRISDDGLVGTTAFVTGHSYAAGAFSTETTVRSEDGRDYGSLENFSMTVDGRPLTAPDRNVWGVTFGGGDLFYVTVASGGKTWLMQGSLAKRHLTSLIENAECPSVSPDGRRISYKKRRAGVGPVHWDIAVLDLATKHEVEIPLKNGLDDQMEWLDDQTLLFGAPRKGAAGDSDVYRIKAEDHAQPELLIEHAWSPSVER